MKKMPARGWAILCACAGCACASPCARAKETGGTWVEAGPAYARMEAGPGKLDMAGVYAGAQLSLIEFTAFELAARGAYTYLDSSESVSAHRHAGGAELVLSASAPGVITPYVAGGVSACRTDALVYAGSDDTLVGPAAEAGVEFTVVPKLFAVTPSVRRFRTDELDTITWALDARLHFSLLGVGVRGEYEDNRSRDGRLTTVMAYAALRF